MPAEPLLWGEREGFRRAERAWLISPGVDWAVGRVLMLGAATLGALWADHPVVALLAGGTFFLEVIRTLRGRREPDPDAEPRPPRPGERELPLWLTRRALATDRREIPLPAIRAASRDLHAGSPALRLDLGTGEAVVVSADREALIKALRLARPGLPVR